MPMAIVKKVRKLGLRPGFGTAAREVSAKRPVFVPRSAPCEHGCPNGTDVRAFLTALAKANTRHVTADTALQQAFGVLVERNPLPGVTGRLCPHHCEARCNREGFDGPVAINLVERAVAVAALERRLRLPGPAEPRPERVAVIGAGAAGLSAAYQLARRGYRVTVFDSHAAPGGELRDPALWGEAPAVHDPWSPPSLPLLDAEIARIAALGVQFDCGIAREPDPAIFTRIVRTRVHEGGPVNPGAIPAAIHYGRHAADSLDADIRGVATERAPKLPPATREHLKLDRYPAAPRAEERHGGLTLDEAIAEAKRCLSCGACFECDNCWKYCPDQAVIKPADAGQPYRFKLEFCQGCCKCAEECPCGYIEMA
ncbi:MAG: FAD-dependent oxidoreductase [Acidobacteria bacterium]|nr:MAG: FAD-dependent oxidoreductase [Acidobacteriota bacterium]